MKNWQKKISFPSPGAARSVWALPGPFSGLPGKIISFEMRQQLF